MRPLSAAVTRLAAICLLLGTAGCVRPKPAATLDTAKMAAVMVGQSSRSDVFATLGRPARTEQSNAGERWIYEVHPASHDNTQLISGAGAAAGVVGAFVPFVGLVGPGLGLVGAATGGPAPEAGRASLSVDFGGNGIVRDCLYTSSDMPAGLQGAAAGRPLGCGRAGAAPAA